MSADSDTHDSSLITRHSLLVTHHSGLSTQHSVVVRMRIESDTLGSIAVPDDALYGAQTQRAVENYPVSGLREHPQFIRTFIVLKKAAALANRELGPLEPHLADSIIKACDQILDRFHQYRRQF